MDARSVRMPLSLLILPTITLSACADSSPAGPSRMDDVSPAAPRAAHGERGKELPIRLNGSGVFAGQEFAPDFGPPTFGTSDFGGRCPEPADYIVRFTGVAEVSHLGTVTLEMSHCGHIDFISGVTHDQDGRMVITAANGDELWMGYEGDSEQGLFRGWSWFTGGTGRFVGASGEGTMRGIADRSTGTLPLIEVEGTIAYDASDRRR